MELLLMLAAAWVLSAPLVLIVWVARHGERLREAEERATALERELRRLRAAQPATAADPAAPPLAPLPAPGPAQQPQPREEPFAERSGAQPDSAPAAALSAGQEAERAERRFVPPPSNPAPERTPLRQSPARPGIDWERWLGVRGAAVVGGVALILAGLFFVQLAIQRGWIGPALRDGIAVAAGALGLSAFTPLQRRGYHTQAAALGGAGTVLIYLGAWAAARVHGLVPAWLAFGAMTATTIVAGHLAVRAVAPVLASFALVGGFATPLLLDIGARSTGALFSYLALLNLAALTIGARPGWSWVPRLSVGATAVVQLVWYLPVLLGGAAAPRPSWTTLAALLSVPFVHAIASRIVAGKASIRSSSLAASVSIVLQVLFAAHLGADLDADATLWPIGAFGLVLAVLSGWIGRRLGVLHAPALGALGGIAVLAIWTELHPARHGSDVVASGSLLDQFAVCAAALIAALVFVELRTSALPKRALGAFSAALAALLVLFGFVQDLGPNAEPLHISLAAVTFAVLGLVAIGGGALRLYAGLPIGAVVGLILTAVTAVESLEPRTDSSDLSYLLGATALGALATLRWSGVGTAVLGCAAAGLVRATITAPGVLVLPALALAVCAGLATFFARRGADANEPNQDRCIDLGIGGFSSAAGFFAVVWLAEASFERIAPTATASLLLVAIALPVPLALALGPGRRLALSAWLTALPALAALSPALGVLAERAGGLRVHALWLAAAAVPFALAGAAALVRRQRQPLERSDWAAFAAPLCAATGLLAAAALARAVGPNPRIVTVALGGTFMALSGLWLARRDVRGLGALLGVLGTFAFISAGFDGSVLPREAALVPPKLTWTTVTVIAGAAVVGPAFGAGLSGVLQLLVAFFWLNLVVVNRFATGATIALQDSRAAERDLTLSAAWLGFAAVLLAIGMWRQTRGLRWASLAVLIATVFKVFLYDLSALEGGERALSFLGLAVALFAVSLIYQRWVLPTRRTTAPSSAKAPPSAMTDTPTM